VRLYAIFAYSTPSPHFEVDSQSRSGHLCAPPGCTVRNMAAVVARTHNFGQPHSIPARCACGSSTLHVHVSIRSGSVPLHFPFLAVSDGDAEYVTSVVQQARSKRSARKRCSDSRQTWRERSRFALLCGLKIWCSIGESALLKARIIDEQPLACTVSLSLQPCCPHRNRSCVLGFMYQ